MDAAPLQKYETLLMELESTLRSELNQSGVDSAPVALDGTMGRISRGDAMQVQQMALDAKRRREKRLQSVQKALQRIQQGTFGFCSRCRDPIAPARLDAFPDAAHCIRCA